MKIYLSSRWQRRLELRSLAASLEAQGHQITSHWISLPDDLQKVMNQTLSKDARANKASRFSQKNLEEISESDLFLALTEVPTNDPEGMGARHIEFGYALGKGVPCLLVGYRENVFGHYTTVMRSETCKSALDCVSRLAQNKSVKKFLQPDLAKNFVL